MSSIAAAAAVVAVDVVAAAAVGAAVAVVHVPGLTMTVMREPMKRRTLKNDRNGKQLTRQVRLADGSKGGNLGVLQGLGDGQVGVVLG